MSDVDSPGDVTRLLRGLRQGDRSAGAELATIVYRELHSIAERLMRWERPGHTLQPTALVSEVYLRLIDSPNRDWQNRAHFFAVAATVMRRLLVDHARARHAEKRGGDRHRVNIDDVVPSVEADLDQVAAIDIALSRLAEHDPRQAKIVELRFFVGLTEEEIAEVLQVSTRTINRDWKMARAWLYAELSGPEQF